MESKNIYDYFNCDSQEELYSKIKAKDPAVNKLYEFYNDYQTEIQTGKFGRAADYANDMLKQKLIPPENTFTVVSVNSKNQPIKYTNYSMAADFKEVFEKSYIGSTARFLYFSGNNRPREQSLIDRNIALAEEAFEKFYGIRSLDYIQVNKDGQFYSKWQQQFVNTERAKASDFAKENSEVYTQPVTLQQEIENLPEFSKYYANKELEGKNVIYDKSEVEHLLQVGYSDLPKEHNCAIKYDQDYNIQEVEVLSIGLVNISLSSPAVNVKNVPQKDKGGAILFHNHPSGHSKPSGEDIENSARNYVGFKMLDKELFDVYVVGKDKVYSFANDGYSLNKAFKQMKINQYEVEEQLNEEFMQEFTVNTNEFEFSDSTENYEQMALFEKQMQYYYDDEYEI